jgi:hypothetical protein
MRINRWPPGGFDLEPGDMVRVSHPVNIDGVWAEVAVADGEPEKTPSWIPGCAAPAMYIGPVGVGDSDRRWAQILHEGRILNVLTTYLKPDF